MVKNWSNWSACESNKPYSAGKQTRLEYQITPWNLQVNVVSVKCNWTKRCEARVTLMGNILVAKRDFCCKTGFHMVGAQLIIKIRDLSCKFFTEQLKDWNLCEKVAKYVHIFHPIFGQHSVKDLAYVSQTPKNWHICSCCRVGLWGAWFGDTTLRYIWRTESSQSPMRFQLAGKLRELCKTLNDTSVFLL